MTERSREMQERKTVRGEEYEEKRACLGRLDKGQMQNILRGKERGRQKEKLEVRMKRQFGTLRQRTDAKLSKRRGRRGGQEKRRLIVRRAE